MKWGIYVKALSGILVSSCGQDEKTQRYSITVRSKILSLAKLGFSFVMTASVSKKLLTVQVSQRRVQHEGRIDHPQLVNLVIIDTAGARHYDYTTFGGSKGAGLVRFTVTSSEGKSDLPANGIAKTMPQSIQLPSLWSPAPDLTKKERSCSST